MFLIMKMEILYLHQELGYDSMEEMQPEDGNGESPAIGFISETCTD